MSAMSDRATEKAWAEASYALFRYESLHGPALVREYERARDLKPNLVNRLMVEAQEDIADAKRWTRFVVNALVLAGGREA